mmetsp:Transcript_60858/g.147156  ORF Transcript_60858/g.147156 Transcript_60858/m.147156 type:complete len:339 (+) Transcript_60858:290-1306(+)
MKVPHLARRDQLVLQATEQAATPLFAVPGKELDALHRVPLVEEERGPQDGAHEPEEGEHLHGHGAHGGEGVLQDKAGREWQRCLWRAELRAEELGKEPDGDHAADAAAEEEGPVGAQPGPLSARRAPDALRQPSVGRERVHHEAGLARAASILGVPVAAVVHDEDVDAQPLVHLLDVLQPVADVAGVPVEVHKGVRHLAVRQALRRLVHQPGVQPGAVLRNDPRVFVGQSPRRGAAELVRVAGERPLRAGRHRHVHDGALANHQEGQQDQEQRQEQLDEPGEAPEDEPKQPKRRARLVILPVGLRAPLSQQHRHNYADAANREGERETPRLQVNVRGC